MLDLDVYGDNSWWRLRPMLSKTALSRLCTRYFPSTKGKKMEDLHEEFKKIIGNGFRLLTGLDIRGYIEELSLDKGKVENPKDENASLDHMFRLKHFGRVRLEANIAQQFVVPVLELLGWIHGRNYLNQVGQTGYADIMLNHNTQDIKIPLEIETPLSFRRMFKKTEKNRTGLYQLEKYVVDEYQKGNKIDYGVLTDGFNWILYKWRNDGKVDGCPVLIFSFKRLYTDPEFFRVFYMIFHAKTWSDADKLYVEEAWKERRPEEVKEEFYMVYQALREYLKSYLEEPWLSEVPKPLREYYKELIRNRGSRSIYKNATLRNRRLNSRLRKDVYENIKESLRRRGGTVVWLEDALNEKTFERFKHDIRKTNEILQKILNLLIILLFLDSQGILSVDLKKEIKRGYEAFVWVVNGINNGGATKGGIPIDGEIFDIESKENKLMFELIKKLYEVRDSGESPFVKVFDFLSKTYDFSPLASEEGSISPEILGYIFERSMPLEERKSTGSYYTPEYVTGYIVEKTVKLVIDDLLERRVGETFKEAVEGLEALLEKAEEGVEKKDLEAALNKAQEILKILTEVKILDPACGSGSFLVKAFNVLYHEYYRPLLYVIDRLHEKLLEKEATLDRWLPRIPFTLAKHIVLNNLYGVDLNPYAVELAKVTMLIALLSTLKPEELDNLPNSMKPLYTLPALRLNIRCGDSLISLKKDMIIEILRSHQSKIKKLYKLREEFISASTSATNPKQLLEKVRELENIISQLKEILIKRFRQELENLPELSLERLFKENPPMFWPLEFWHVYFDENGLPLENQGFHVVIGNPPYVDSEEMTKTMPHIRIFCNMFYEASKGNWDLFCIFIERAIQLTRKGGYHSFIVPNKLLDAEYASSIRKIMLNECEIREIRDYSKVKVFSANVYPIVYVLKKSTGSKVLVEVMKESDSIPEVEFRFYVNSKELKSNIENWSLVVNPVNMVMFKIRTASDPLEMLEKHNRIEISGASTVSEAYDVKDLLMEFKGKSLDPNKYFKFVNTGTIDKFLPLWGMKKLRYLGKSFQKPFINRKDVENRLPRRYEQSKRPKIIIAGMSLKIECFCDDKAEFMAGKSTSIILDSKNDGCFLKMLSCILNSKVIDFQLTQTLKGLSMSGGYIRIGPPQLKKLLLPKGVTKVDCTSLAKLYDKIADKLRIRYNLLTLFKEEIRKRRRSLKTNLYDILRIDEKTASWGFNVSSYPSSNDNNDLWQKEFESFHIDLGHEEATKIVTIYGTSGGKTSKLYVLSHESPHIILATYLSLVLASNSKKEQNLLKLLKNAWLLKGGKAANINLINNIVKRLRLDPEHVIAALIEAADIEAQLDAEIMRMYNLSRREAEIIMRQIGVPDYLREKIRNNLPN